MRLGLEVCLERPPAVLTGARIGLLVNQASVDRDFVPTHERFAARFGKQVRALFGPQHGLWSEQQDNMIETPHAIEPRLRVPIHSLYADARKPTPSMLADIDVLVVDLQDVGTRVYTYVWTLLLCLEACRDAGVRVLVLDRPNPLGGMLVEGPRLDPTYRSFVGLAPMPMRHGLTLAEAARFLNRDIGADLHVVAMADYERTLDFAATGRRWLPPSPNLPRLEAVGVYPGQVLLEGTDLSEGRGTTTPFEVCGAPFVDPHAWRDALAAFALPGVALRPYRFEPTFQKWCGRSCGGLFLHVTDPVTFRPYRTTLALLAALRRVRSDGFAWRPPPYEYEHKHWPIDILSGGSTVRTTLDGGATPADVERLAAVDANEWWRDVGAARIYGPDPF